MTDEIWADAAGHFDQRQLSAIILEITLSNFFNRINTAVRERPARRGEPAVVTL